MKAKCPEALRGPAGARRQSWAVVVRDDGGRPVLFKEPLRRLGGVCPESCLPERNP